jgi:hypothetical protein
VILIAALVTAIIIQLLLARAFGPLPGAARDDWGVALALFGLLALSGGAVTWAAWLFRDKPAHGLVMASIAAAGLLMRIPYLGSGPLLEDDHYRYLLDGAMVARGLSPYALSPESLLTGAPPGLAGLVEAGRAEIEAINFRHLRTIYPGTAQMLFAIAHWIAPWKIDGLRLVIFAAEALTAILVWRWLRDTGRPTSAVALYWCNPLMAFCLTGQAHIDAALAPPILFALLAICRKQGLAAGAALGLAVGVKLWPLLLAPLIARALWPDRRRLIVFSLALAIVTLITCGPLLWASLSAKAGLTAYASSWSINNAPFHWLSWLFAHAFGTGAGEAILRIVIIAAAACMSLCAGLLSWKGPDALAARAALVAAALFYLSPAQFPWYAAWFLPLAAASVSWVLSFGAIGLPVYFLFFPLITAGQRDIFEFWIAAFHLAPLLAACALRRRLNSRVTG